MVRNHRILLACLLLLGFTLGCSQLSPDQTALQPTPIPGWEKFEGRGIQLWLPESFEGGDAGQTAGGVVEALRNLGPDYESIAQTIEQNPELFVLYTFDTTAGSQALTNVNVTYESLPIKMNVDGYLDAMQAQLPSQFQILDRDVTTLGDYPAGRLVIQAEFPGTLVKELMYTVMDGTDVWVVTYATGLDEFEQRLPIFEQSALTFTIQE